jgi:hypothetical protein
VPPHCCAIPDTEEYNRAANAERRVGGHTFSDYYF